MLYRALAITLLAAAAGQAQKPSREIQELQRDVAQLQEEIRTLKQSFEQRLGAATSAIETVGKSLAQLNDSAAAVRKSIEEQERKLGPLIAAQGTRVDQMAASFTTMQHALADLATGVTRIQTQIVDLGNAVKIISTPAPKPPSAEELLKSAEADRLGGKYELAAQGYSEFLRTFADSSQADVAQFQLGMVHHQMKDLDSAVKDFEAVARNYPKSPRVPDALFYQARVLRELNRASDAIAACKELRRRYPRHEFVRECSIAR